MDTTPILSAWRYFMKDVPTAESYIEMSFYAMIAAALQRRVYFGSETWPIFPNLFTVLVGPPATGKSMAITPTKKVIEQFKQKSLKLLKKEDVSAMSDTERLEAVEALTREFTNTNQIKNLHGLDALTRKEPLLIPVAAQATTYEGMVKAHCESLRTIVPANPNTLCRDGMYSHSSLYCVTDEISSLFRKHTDDLVNYLVKAYDCDDYEYAPKNATAHFVKTPCLNLLAGTQPNFIKRIFAEQLLTEGFASRTIFVYEDKPRFFKDEIDIPTADQLAAREIVTQHVKKLTTLFGRVEQTPECRAYTKYLVEEKWPYHRINDSPKLDSYYGRKNLHLKKMMLGMHFGESVEMAVGIEIAQRAESKLETIERNMDLALSIGGRNQLHHLHDKIVAFVKRHGGATRIQIWAQFAEDFSSEKEVDETISFLLQAGKLEHKGNKLT